MPINWGEVLKTVGPAAVSATAGALNARSANQTEREAIARRSESDAAQLAIDRDRLALQQQQEARAAEDAALRNMLRSALIANTQDASFDRSGFRSPVANISFSGGSRPSALGDKAGEIASLMEGRALRTLMAEPGGQGGGGDKATPRSAPAGESGGGGSSIWEKALGLGVGLGPMAAGMFGGKGRSTAKGVADGVGGSVMNTMNSIAGPAAMGAGLVAPFLPEGKARGAASGASTGAMIGSFVPGVGNAVGAGVGALVGAIAGNKNSTAGDREDFAKKAGYRDLGDLYNALEALGPEGQRLREIGLNVIGKKDKEANAQWMQEVAAVLGRR